MFCSLSCLYISYNILNETLKLYNKNIKSAYPMIIPKMHLKKKNILGFIHHLCFCENEFINSMSASRLGRRPSTKTLNSRRMQWLECQLWNETRTWPGAFLLANCGPWADEQTSRILHSLPTKWRPYFHHRASHWKAYTIYWFSIIAQEVFFFFLSLDWKQRKKSAQGVEKEKVHCTSHSSVVT